MASLPQLVHSTAQGGTIHKYELSGGKRSFLRYLGCYLGSCKFCNDMEEASSFLESVEGQRAQCKKITFSRRIFIIFLSTKINSQLDADVQNFNAYLHKLTLIIKNNPDMAIKYISQIKSNLPKISLAGTVVKKETGKTRVKNVLNRGG